MVKYKTLLFDLDDTLLDFRASEEVALQNLFKDQQYTLTPDIKDNYKKLNSSLWKAYENDEIDREEVVNTRFALLFQQHYGIEVDGVALGENYRKYLSEGHHLMEGALELIQTLHMEFDLYIVSNGASHTQHKRLRDSGLAPYFKKVFVSEDTGYQKPMKAFFDYVFSRIENLDLKRTLIVGDSFSADVIGGWNASIDTCWINLAGQENQHPEITPTYEIRKLAEIYGVLGIESHKLGSSL